MRMSSEECIASDHPALSGHFPQDPIVPGVLLLSRIASLIEAGWKEPFGPVTISAVKFKTPLRPGEPFSIMVESADAREFAYRITRGDTLVVSGRMRREDCSMAAVMS